MTTWFTADLHLGHRNIIDYCGRPFHDADEMNRALIERWNQTVATTDEVWVLGDFALGKLAEVLPMVSELHGRKILLAGNHDRCWVGHGERAAGWSERYLEAGFDEIQHHPTTISIGETSVLMSHLPYRGDSREYDRFVEHRPADRGSWLLHGHVHERWTQDGRMINVGVDVHDFRPISEGAIAEMIAAGPTHHASER